MCKKNVKLKRRKGKTNKKLHDNIIKNLETP